MTIRLLALAASLRRDSLNRRLLLLAAEVARRADADVDLAEFREFDMPLYDADLEAASGRPAGAERLKSRLEPAQGILLASPEYNFSMPGTLKNAIDWISRFKPTPLRGKSALLLSASNGLVGGNRGLWALRVPLESLGVMVYPDMFSLAQAEKAFAADGTLADSARRDRLERVVGGYVATAQALAAVPGG